MKRLTILTHRRLDDDRSGSKTYLRRMIQLATEAGYSVHITSLPRTTFGNRPWGHYSGEFARSCTTDWPGTVRLGKYHVTFSPGVWARFGWRLVQEAMRQARIGPESWRKPLSNLAAVPPRRELEQVASLVRRTGPDAVLVEYSSLGPLLRLLPDGTGKALIVHDSFAARASQFAARGEASDYPDPPSFAQEAERLSGADVIFHASMTELDRFRALVPGPDHVWFRPTAPVLRSRLQRREAAELLYVGANQQGSRDAVRHFIRDIWPRVQSALPDAVLNIVGPVGAAIDPALKSPGIRVHGLVDDLAVFAGPDMIGVLPTRLMSGISIKVGEYLGLGVPVVGYEAGFEGYGNVLEGVVASVTDPERFAEAAIGLVRDRAARERSSEAGLRAAETVLQNPDVIAALSELTRRKPAAPGS